MSKTKDPGLGSKYEREVKRLVNEDGSYNIVRIGALRGFKDVYKFMIDIPWIQFILLSFIGFLLVNCIFACLYLIIGVDQLSQTNTEIGDFLNAFFFSSQTLTSLGYGQISPIGIGTNLVATFESFVGIISIALITGLLYGRFSKPRSKVKYSKNMIFTPFQDKKALMFKMVNKRDSALMKTRVTLILLLDKGVGEGAFNKEFHRLELQLDNLNFFPLTWTVVHIISEESPLYGISLNELKERNAEVIVYLEAFDETHNQSIIERRSYAGEQFIEGVKFTRNYDINDDGMIELRINDLDKTSSADQ